MTDSDDPLRMKLTFQIAAIGIAALVFSFLIALFVFSDADEPGQVIVAVLGPVVGVVGTLAGYVAGQTAGAAGRNSSTTVVRGLRSERCRRSSWSPWPARVPTQTC